MNKAILSFLLLFKTIYRQAGADIDQLVAIMKAKLLMDDRKPMGAFRSSGKRKTQWASVGTVIMSGFTGLVYIMPLLVMKDTLLAYFMYFTMFAFFLSIMLITDFVSVLIDTRDKVVLFTRPVNDQTIFIARILHICIYLIRIVIPMMMAGLLTSSIIHGWRGALIIIVGATLLMMTVLFLVLGIYMLLIRITTPQKFKAILGNFQILVSIAIFGFYYLIPKMIDSTTMEQLQATSIPWIKWLPTYWIASIWTWLQPVQNMLPYTKWLGMLAIIFPAICLWIAIKYLAPSFIARLSSLDTASIEPTAQVVFNNKKKGTPLYKKLSVWLNKNSIAQAGFEFAWLQTQRSRLFKQKVYPSFGFVPIYFLFLVIRSGDDITNIVTRLRDTNAYISLLYISGFVLIQAINYITYSDQFKASWVFSMARSPYAGTIMGGAFKVIVVKYFVPFFLAIAAFALYIWGGKLWIDILLAFANVLVYSVLFLLVSYRKLPFSQPETMKNMGSRTMIVFAVMAFAGAMGIGHYLALNILWLKLLFLVLSSVLLWVVWDSYIKTTWAVVSKD